ncbi:MAG: VanZ family protein [Defluviitoga tunisiensis]|uniref:VanZ like family protein n=1 Tax=Defluviitoga tunisiensis TaxID=1006576 RepID=A0A0C7P256_DEFTU|nr:VanZ family protein [Defluviitoga tunisiensis]CEP78064.1 VanZ like family protein [Defluviitoga tunisiensis]
MSKTNDDNKTNNLTKILFIIYMIALFWIIIFKFDIPFSNLGYMRSINLIPFSESLIINDKLNFREMIMNAVIFLPLGIYLEILFKKYSTGRKIFFVFLISFICEVSQFILGVGASDITDIINNMIGGIIGIAIYKVIVKIIKNDVKAQKIINVIATIGTIFMTLLLIIITISNH